MPPEEQPPEEQSFFGEERRSGIPPRRSFLSSVKKFFSQLNTPRRQSFKRSDGLTRRHKMPLKGNSLEAGEKRYRRKRGVFEQVLFGPGLEKKKDEKTPDVSLFEKRKLIKRSELRQWMKMKRSEFHKIDRLSVFERDKKIRGIFPKMRKGYLKRRTVKLKLKELRTQRYKDQTLKGRKEIDKTMRVLEKVLGDKKY